MESNATGRRTLDAPDSGNRRSAWSRFGDRWKHADEARSDDVAETAWRPASRVLFRFVAGYLTLIALLAYPIPLYDLPGGEEVIGLVDGVWDRLIPWIGEHVLHLGYAITVKTNGSGDTTYNYVQLAVLLAMAGAVCLGWTLLDRRRTDYRALARWLLTAGRYYLAVVLLIYGMVKVFKAQFPFPGLERLMQPYGDSSPMGLAWTFMGYSKLYNVFSGGGEVLGALLLFFRRTTTLGALVAFPVMSNVVMLNFAYDIPVKLFSSYLLLLAVVLVAVDGRRLLNVLVLNRPAPAADLSPLFATRRANYVRWAVKTLLIGFFLFQTVSTGMESERKWGDKRARPPLYGIYEVSTFVQDGEKLPPLVTDTSRWRHLIVDREGYVSVQLMDGELKRYRFKVDESAKTAEIWAYERFANADFRLGDAPKQELTRFTWAYDRPSPGALNMAGELDGSHLSLKMKARDPNDFLLVRRGFHWINETPFNR